MDISRYEELPEGIEASDLLPYFREVLDYEETCDAADETAVAEALFELADRQWHTYEIIDADVRVRIEKWVEKVWTPAEWDSNALQYANAIAFIVCNLGLMSSFRLIKTSLPRVRDDNIRDRIEEVIKEVGSNIEDPYSGMPRT